MTSSTTSMGHILLAPVVGLRTVIMSMQRCEIRLLWLHGVELPVRDTVQRMAHQLTIREALRHAAQVEAADIMVLQLIGGRGKVHHHLDTDTRLLGPLHDLHKVVGIGWPDLDLM